MVRTRQNRLSEIVANSRRKTQDLARPAYQSRTQFHRLFRAVNNELDAGKLKRGPPADYRVSFACNACSAIGFTRTYAFPANGRIMAILHVT